MSEQQQDQGQQAAGVSYTVTDNTHHVTQGDENHPATPAEEEPGAAAAAQNQNVNQDQNQTESADDNEPDKKSTEGRKDRFQARIHELTAERDKAREAQQAAQERLAQFHAQQQQSSLRNQWLQHQPRLENFETVREYEQAYQQWSAAAHQAEQQHRFQSARQAQAVAAQQQFAAQRRGRLEEIAREGAAAHQDFLATVTDPRVPDIERVNPVAFSALLESERAAELSYYFAKNPTELVQLEGLSPVATIRRMLELEQKVRSSTTQQQSTNQDPAGPASPPPTHVRSQGSSAVTDLSKVSDIDEWMAKRNAQVAGTG